MPDNWSNKVVLVTGGSAGLGLAIARAFATAGARAMLAARDPARLQQAVESLRAAGLAADGIAADVTRDDDVARLIDATLARHGRLDVLVNNAGRSTRGAVLDTSAAQMAELIDVNFLSAVRCTQAAAAPLRTAGGHVVFIGSLASKTASAWLGAYPASKFPLAAYAQQIRLEHSRDELHSLLVCPGPLARDDAGRRYDEAAEKLPAEARRPGGGAAVRAIDPAWLAARIVRACQRREPELVVPAKARLLFALSQLAPRWGDWLLRRNLRK